MDYGSKFDGEITKLVDRVKAFKEEMDPYLVILTSRITDCLEDKTEADAEFLELMSRGHRERMIRMHLMERIRSIFTP